MAAFKVGSKVRWVCNNLAESKRLNHNIHIGVHCKPTFGLTANVDAISKSSGFPTPDGGFDEIIAVTFTTGVTMNLLSSWIRLAEPVTLEEFVG